MKKDRLSKLLSIMVFGLVLSFGTVYTTNAEDLHDGMPTDPNQLRGVVSEVGPDYIILNMERFTLSKEVIFKNEEGGELENGITQVKADMQVDLTFEDNKIVSITIYGLLMH
ncbi:MAG: hypothetical protein ACE5GK_05780 [Nitrospiria bacterium]